MADLCGRAVLSPRGVVAVWSSLFLLLWLARVLLYIGAGADEAEQLVDAQNWRWSYAGHSPPLFTWILATVQPFLGVSVGTVLLVKYGMLAASYALLFLIARRMLSDERLAALAALSPLGMYYVAWDATFNYTHSISLIFFVCLTFYAFLRLRDGSRLRDYLLFGIAVGGGLLTKYNYALFLGALLAAALIESHTRGRVLNPRMVPALVLGLSIAAPHFLSVLRNPQRLIGHIGDRFNVDLTNTDLVSFSFARMLDAPNAALMMLLPLVLLLALFFPRACLPLDGAASPYAPERRLLGATLLLIVVASAIGMALLDISRVRNHHMFMLILFPVYFFARVDAAGIGARAASRFSVVLAGLASIVAVAVLAKYPLDPYRDGRKAYFNVPYGVLAQQLRAAGFERGTIIGDWFGYPIAGNLRPYFPDSRIVNLHDWRFLPQQDADGRPILGPPERSWTGQCLLIWSPPGAARRGTMFASARVLFAADPSAELPMEEIAAEMPPASGRMAQFFYTLIPEGSGNCR